MQFVFMQSLGILTLGKTSDNPVLLVAGVKTNLLDIHPV